jgi:hypothetical protein
MILDKVINVNIGSRNLKYYKDLGYDVYYNHNLDVLVSDLSKNSRVKVNVKCDLCDTQSKINIQSYNISISKFGYYKCNKHSNIHRDYVKLDNKTELEVIESYNSGLKVNDILSMFNISSVRQLQRILKRGGRDKIIPGKKYNFNESFFEKIDTENKAYWLGFLFADGFVRKRGNSFNIELKLASRDRNHLLKFKEAIESNNKIKDSFIKRTYKSKDVIYYSSGLCLSSKKMFQDLERHGCVERKSLILEPPKNVSEDLIPHFIRGYFDGDGYISNYILRSKKEYKIGILGTQCLLEWINKILSQNGLSKRKINFRNKISIIQYNKKDKDLFFDYLYKNANIFLERKYIKFKN